MELLAIVVGGRVLDLSLNFGHTTADTGLFAATAHEGRVVFLDNDLFTPTEVFEGGGVELAADLVGDDGSAGEDRDVLEHGLSAVAKTWGFDGDAVEGAAELVHDERRECFALDIFGDHDDVFAGLQNLLEQRK